jgi:hypothetical protein
VIVAVLSLAGAAYESGPGAGVSRLLAAGALVLLAVFAPWALMRLLPFTEVAAGAAGYLRAELPRAAAAARGWTDVPVDAPGRLGTMLRQARDTAAALDPVPRLPTASPESPRGATPPPEAPTTRSPASAAVTRSSPGIDAAPSAVPSGSRSSSSTADPAAGTPADGPKDSRPPIDSIWRAGDLEWPPMVLGPGGWQGPTTWTPDPAPEESPGPDGAAR